jgi:hypothetical protein
MDDAASFDVVAVVADSPCGVPGKKSSSSQAMPFRLHMRNDRATIMSVKANKPGPVSNKKKT